MSSDIVRAHLRAGELLLARAGARGALRTCRDPHERALLDALLARTELALGRPRGALDRARRAVDAWDHWETRLALGEAWVGAGEPGRARVVLREVLEAMGPPASRAVGLAASQVGTALAEASRAAGEPETGLAEATRAQWAAEAHVGPTAPEVAAALRVVGECQRLTGDPDGALVTLTRALDIAWAHGGATVAAVLDALGAAERTRGSPFLAVAHHREALERWEAVAGEDSGPVGGCLHALAQATHRTGDFLAAHAHMARALAITARTMGADHLDTHITAFELGRMEVDIGQMEEGFGRMEAARAVVRERLGRDHPVVLAMARWL